MPAAVAGANGIVADHYGDPVAEQRMLAAGRAIVDLSDRGVVTVTGPDRLTWLDSLTSQSLTSLAPGQSAETLLLDPNGRLEHAMHVIDDGEVAWLLVDGAAAPALAAWLDRMRFMMRVEVADVSPQWATLAQLLPLDAEPLVAPAAPNGQPLLWRDPWVSVQSGGWQYAAESEHPAAQFDVVELLVERARLAEIADAVRAAALAVAGALALEALRIAAWRPRFGTEVDDRTIPHELDWLRSAVHLAKGCYRGQETVAKVHNLGHPPRRLVMLHLDGSDALLPGHGAPVMLEGAAVGVVTSSARHHELGPIALAVVKRSLDPSAALTVEVDGVPIAAAQQVIVPPDAGATAGVPRLPRLGAVTRPS
ncbi:glycine cleavage T C-terminal barrel domain-containing protein [Microcella sp.]|uniref:CAF17-like 4Fe-4S cluster assembly/insertion protein YgfZ n=1 Tax=Microcella sp. TaxID=1913979 RepID=UPI0026140E2C|nr:glycine cleavage T C-terminal barrel domain-containing protein [Microcella sp.]